MFSFTLAFKFFVVLCHVSLSCHVTLEVVRQGREVDVEGI